MQDTFFDLVVTNMRRTARLCRQPGGLAQWALEILQSQAEHALRFVQEYDSGTLGLGDLVEVASKEEARARAHFFVAFRLLLPLLRLPLLLLGVHQGLGKGLPGD